MKTRTKMRVQLLNAREGQRALESISLMISSRSFPFRSRPLVRSLQEMEQLQPPQRSCSGSGCLPVSFAREWQEARRVRIRLNDPSLPVFVVVPQCCIVFPVHCIRPYHLASIDPGGVVNPFLVSIVIGPVANEDHMLTRQLLESGG